MFETVQPHSFGEPGLVDKIQREVEIGPRIKA